MSLRNLTGGLMAVVLLIFGAGCVGPKPAWELPAPPAREAPIVKQGTLVRKTLPNGLRVLLLEDRSRPMVTLGLSLRRGIALDPEGKQGVAALMGEVMQRGAGERDALELANAVEELGASLGVQTGWDSIGVRASGLSRDAEALLGFVADLALRPRFAAEEVERARAEQLAGLAGGLDDPRTILGWQLARTLYPGHRYGVPASGLPETVAGLAVEDVRAFHARVFAPGNAIFHAAGDFEPARLLALVEQAFGDWRPKPVPKPVPAPPRITPTARGIVVVDRPDMVQVQIAVAHEGLQRNDPRRIPAAMLNNVLGGSGFSSRLMVQLRSEAGLTYGIRSGFALRRRPGQFSISTFTRADQVRPALDLLLAEVAAIRSDRPPTEVELRNAKAFSIGHFALGLETSAAVLASLVNLDIHDLPEDSLDTYRQRVNEVTVPEITDLAKTLLHPDRAAIVIVGPATQLLPELEGLAPIQVVTWP